MRGADHEEVVSVRIAEELPRDVWVLFRSVCKQNFERVLFCFFPGWHRNYQQAILKQKFEIVWFRFFRDGILSSRRLFWIRFLLVSASVRARVNMT